jgi:hypothetical protein
MQLTLAQQMELNQAVGNWNSLLTLDGILTSHLANPPSYGPQDLAALNTLSEAIDNGFVQAAADAQTLSSLIDTDPTGFNALLSARFDAIRTDAAQIASFRQAAQQAGGFAALAKRALATIVAAAPMERRDIKSKVAELIAGGNPPGDMSKRAECALITAACCTFIIIGALPLAGGALGGFFGRGCLDQ